MKNFFGEMSWRYRGFGAALAVLVVSFVAFHGGISGETLVAGGLFMVLAVLTVTDLQAMLMPNRIVFPAIAAMLVLRCWIHQEPVLHYLLGFLVGGAVLTLLGLVTNGLGGGDVKVFALIGLALGVKVVLLALFFSCLWGTLIGLPLRLTRRIRPRQLIPFGPFILLGTLTAWAYGDSLWRWYLLQWG